MPDREPSDYRMPTEGAGMLVLARGGEVYVIAYTDSQAAQAELKLGQWASHPDLSLTWEEAEAGKERIRQRQKAIARSVEATCEGA